MSVREEKELLYCLCTTADPKDLFGYPQHLLDGSVKREIDRLKTKYCGALVIDCDEELKQDVEDALAEQWERYRESKEDRDEP
jgi:hypothetical protein